MKSASFLAVLAGVLLCASAVYAEYILSQVPVAVNSTGGDKQHVDDYNDVPGWAKGGGIIIGLLGGPGFAVWYAWFMSSKRIPEIEKNHADQLDGLEKRHADHINLLITNFRADQVSMWNIKREDDKTLANAMEKMADKLDDRSCKFTQHG